MSDKKLFMTLLVLLIALLAACAPGQAAQPTTEPAPAETPIAETPMSETPDAGNTSEAVTAAAVARLAADLGLAEADVTVLSAEETEFTDGCLGLGGPADSCLQAITPGWLVMLSANGQEYEAHTDATGQQVRIAGLDGSSSTGAVDAITASAAAVLADQLGIAPDAITVVSAEETEFSDGCLGLGGSEESCLQAITPGWIVTLSADGQEYVAHTDATGVQVRIAE
jgi:glucose/arabinose dehydrogenase